MKLNEPSAAIEPAGPAGGPVVVLAADARYAPYLAAALASLAASASADTFYDVIVLSSGINGDEQKKIGAALVSKNISLRFFEVRETVERRAGDFFVNAHLSPATYYRLFTPSIFTNYDKILFLDCDVIVLEDAATLYGQDLRGLAVGAMRDFFAIRDLPRRKAARWALQLGMKDVGNYFNAGVLLLNLARLRAGGYEERWFERLRAVKTPRLHDQDILNHTLEGEVVHLDAAWNSLAWNESLGERVQPGELAEPLYAEYLASMAAPRLLHYSSRHKPWDLPHVPLAEHFWEAAARTPYYDALIFNALKRLSAENDVLKGRLRLPPAAFKGLFYALMGRLVPGEAGARFRAKAFRSRAMNPGLKSLLRSWH